MLTPRYLLIVYLDKSGGWRWSIEHRNGNIIADSGEGYASRSVATRAAVAALADKLQGYLDGNDALDGVYRGEVKANKDTLSLLTQDSDLHATIEKWIVNRKHSKLAELWLKGL